MTKVLPRVLAAALALALAACGGGSKGGSPVPGGAGGDGGSGGAIPPPPGPGTGGSSGSGGSSGAGGSGGGESTPADAAPTPTPDDAAVATGDAGPITGGASAVPGWYEAEAIPPNEKAPRSELHTGGTACKTTPPMQGERCLSGGGQVTWITQGRQGWLQFNQVMAPADGMYDVDWWYHCGNNDNFGDKHCGGQTDPPTTASGCRPHNIIVNGTELMGTYHWPCFPGSFGEIHAVTVQLPLKAGPNTIRVYPKSRDSADMDAIHVKPLGKGIGPLIKSNNVSGVN
jgi:hypothetical protein